MACQNQNTILNAQNNIDSLVFNSLEFVAFKTTNIGMDLAPHIELHT